MPETPKRTPMMKQYWRFKADTPDAILFFHLGDFYETFFEDAETVARELDIVLTARNGHPMAGVPVRRGEAYMQQLLAKGYKVAVCQQVEDPKQAKGLVKREIVRIVTPGTVMEDGLLSAGANNYLAAVDAETPDGPFGVAFLDLSTGEFLHTTAGTEDELVDELTRRAPSELLLAHDTERLEELDERFFVTRVPPHSFVLDPDRPFALGEGESGLRAAGALRAYVERTQKTSLSHIRRLEAYALSDQMDLDAFTIASLELVKPLREGTERGTLLHALDATVTSMGRRRLRRRILSPLTERSEIEGRLDAVELLTGEVLLRQQLREQVGDVHDLERLIGKLGAHRMRPGDLQALLDSLERIPAIQRGMGSSASQDALPPKLLTIQRDLSPDEL